MPRLGPAPARLDSARAFRRTWWPGTGAISVIVGPDRTPRLKYAKQRISMAEATGYFEFLLEVTGERPARSSRLRVSAARTLCRGLPGALRMSPFAPHRRGD